MPITKVASDWTRLLFLSFNFNIMMKPASAITQESVSAKLLTASQYIESEFELIEIYSLTKNKTKFAANPKIAVFIPSFPKFSPHKQKANY